MVIVAIGRDATLRLCYAECFLVNPKLSQAALQSGRPMASNDRLAGLEGWLCPLGLCHWGELFTALHLICFNSTMKIMTASVSEGCDDT